MATSVSAAEKARQIAAKYSGEGQSFQVKYLGTQEVSSAKGDAVIADCLKELRMLFKDVVTHLPKVKITLQLSGVTVVDEKSKLETIKVPLNQISYVCLDPADESVFSFIIRTNDTISSKGLRLHAFVCHPQVAITFNRSARELFDFMSRLMRAKKKMAQQETEATAANSHQPSKTQEPPPVSLLNSEPGGAQAVVPALSDPWNQPPEEQIQLPAESPFAGPTNEEKRQQTVFDEWKELEKELDEIGQDLGVSSPAKVPVTSTPTSSPPLTTSENLAPKASQQPAPSLPPPAPQSDIMTASGSDPFSSSFFDNSFGVVQASTAAVVAAASKSNGDSNVFDNPVFNGDSDKTEASPGAVPSTPEGKRLTYSSRPRPKGKSLDTLSPLSPPPVPDVATDGGQLKGAREVSLSPDSEEQVKSILTNTDPFSPPSLDAFQFPQPSSNESGFFQPTSFTPVATPNSGVFSPTSVMSQDSIQLVNPLYQGPYTPNGSFSGPFSPSAQVPYQMAPAVMSPPPAVVMQHQYQAQQPPVMMQQVPALVQPQVLPDAMTPQGMLPVGVNSFDGILSPMVVSSPPRPEGSGWPPPNPSEVAVQREQRDRMFADLLPQTSHPIPEKKKKFEPEMKKVAKPTLAELQEKKKKEQEQAFMASTSAASPKEKSEDLVDWPSSSFDDVAPTQVPEAISGPPLASSSPVSTATATGTQPTPSDSAGQENPFAQVFNSDMVTRGSQDQKIASAFETQAAPESEAGPSPPATNDPFAPTGTAASPTEKTSSPWSTF